MTSKTSLFNRGIYKSTVIRYIWGAVFYAIVLFMCTALPILFSENPENSWRVMGEYNRSLILDDMYLFFPLIIGIAVPTVVALLVYRFVHSKKTSVFVHSLPVSRCANYTSTVAAALTLMMAPIIFNGLILTLMSVCGYGVLFDVSSCLIWTGLNLLGVFLMFSVASVAAFLTGNSFAMVGINALIHLVAIIFAGSFSSLAGAFLYGYYEMNTLLNAAVEWNFVGYVMSLAAHLRYYPESVIFDLGKLIIMIVLALVLYVAAFLLYKKRRMETAEDVAAYKVLNPIYKYLLTFIVAIGVFAIFSYDLDESVLLPVFMMVLISAVVYFAAEMVLKKSFKIWGSYKGYLIFLVAFAALIFVFAFTSFFGFETRVPEIGDVESFAVCEQMYSSEIEDPYVEDEELMEYVIEKHRAFAEREKVPTVRTYTEEEPRALFIRYKLKNGGELIRQYYMSEREFCEILDRFYKSETYKIKNLEAFSDRIGEIYEIELNSADKKITGDDIGSFMECLQKDLLALDYTESRVGEAWEDRVHIEYIPTDELSKDEDSRMINIISQRINANYKNTIKWLVDNGYINGLFNSSFNDLTILTHEQWQSFVEYENALVAKDYDGPTVDVAEVRTFEDIPGAVRITDAETKAKIRNFVINTGVRYTPDKEYSYYVCTISGDNNYVNVVAAFYDDAEELLEFVK